MENVRCERCNLIGYVEVKTQPDSDPLIPNLFKLQRRSFLHCKACNWYETVDNWQKKVLSN